MVIHSWRRRRARDGKKSESVRIRDVTIVLWGLICVAVIVLDADLVQTFNQRSAVCIFRSASDACLPHQSPPDSTQSMGKA